MRKVLEMQGFPIVPFLTTSDLLRLSETATWLQPYRNQLDVLKVSTKGKKPSLAYIVRSRPAEGWK